MLKLLRMENKNFVWPDFKHSIVNLAATMAQFLGKTPRHPVLPQVADQLKTDYKNVVYMVIDAMGDSVLKKNLHARSFFRTHQIDTVTSVFPSTTAAATTSLLSGLTPAEHGWFAWSVDFDGQVIEVFRNRNFYTREILADPEFVEKCLPYEKIYEGIHSDRAIYTCVHEKVSNIHSPHEIKYQTLGQMFRRLHQICAQPDKKFIYAYYSDLDTVMHEYGTQVFRTRWLIKSIERHVKRLVKQHPDTLFVITADHGQTNIAGFTYICDDPDIQDCLAHPISLDPRGACFKIKPGQFDKFQKAFAKYTDDYALFPTDELIQKNLFGAFDWHPDYRQYLGDFIAIGKDTGKMLVFKPGEQYHGNHHLYHGIHTGLTPEEMLVPVIIVAGGRWCLSCPKLKLCARF